MIVLLLILLTATPAYGINDKELIELMIGFYPSTTYSIEVTVSAYTARKQETDETPWQTADLTLSRVGLAAISVDLKKELGIEFGDVIILKPYGVFRVRDIMNPRWRRRVDLLMAHPVAAKKFGIKKHVAMYFFDK